MAATAIPVASKGDNATIFNATLTANWQASSVVSLLNNTRCALSIRYDADAGGTANRMQFLVFVSNHTSAPAVGDDEWVPLTEVDTSGTATTLTGTVPSGGDITVAPEWANHVVRGVSFKTEAADNGTDKMGSSLVLDVRSWKYLHLWVKELGDTDAGDVGVTVIESALSA